MSDSWRELREELAISEEDEVCIEWEKELIRTLIHIRGEKGLTQAQLAEMCHVSQPYIGRLETGTHSPRLSSLLRVLVSLGYKLQIVPVNQKNKE